jgi:hypothetical protein
MIGFGAAGMVLGIICLMLIHQFEKDGIWFNVLFCSTLSGLAILCLVWLPFVAPPDMLKSSPAGYRVEDVLAHTAVADTLFDRFLALFLLWLVAIFVLLGCLFLLAGYPLWIWTLWATKAKVHAHARPAVTAAFVTSLIQVGLWVLIVPLLGMGALLYLDRGQVTGGDNSAFAHVWTRFTLHLLLAAVPVVVAICVWGARWFRARPYFRSGRQVPEPPPTIPRLIANVWLVGAILLVSLVGFVFFLHSSLTGIHWAHDWMKGHQWWFMGGSLAVIALAYFIGRNGLLEGLHILRDVIGHFYRTKIGLRDFWRPVAQFVDPETFANLFTLQRQIEHRFCAVLEQVLRRRNVTRLTVVSHSQGSVVAILSLYLNSTHDLLKAHGVKEVRLVTMGSPYTHLYQHYFPYRYPPLYTDPARDPAGFNTRQWQALREVLSHWLNVFRIDDFVGTVIYGDCSGTFPRNQWVYGSGHTGYWIDENALGVIRGWLPGSVHTDPPRRGEAPLAPESAAS